VHAGEGGAVKVQNTVEFHRNFLDINVSRINPSGQDPFSLLSKK
jgi:hypothetical protein